MVICCRDHRKQIKALSHITYHNLREWKIWGLPSSPFCFHHSGPCSPEQAPRAGLMCIWRPYLGSRLYPSPSRPHPLQPSSQGSMEGTPISLVLDTLLTQPRSQLCLNSQVTLSTPLKFSTKNKTKHVFFTCVSGTYCHLHQLYRKDFFFLNIINQLWNIPKTYVVI